MTTALPVLQVRERGVCCALPIEVDTSWAARRAELLKAIADPTRLAMLAVLWHADRPVCICDFTAELSITQPTVSHHMAKLREAGLVSSTKDGIWSLYSLSADLAAETRKLLEPLLA